MTLGVQGAPIPVLKGAPCEEVHVTVLHQRRGEGGTGHLPWGEGGPGQGGWLLVSGVASSENLSPAQPKAAPRLLCPQLGDHTARGRPPGCEIKGTDTSLAQVGAGAA